ncbi:MAG: MFS transporter [Limnobacter sp.]|nr:MFS transporter [Limnobacter sp.]
MTRPGPALISTLLVQTLASLVLTAPPVLAPVVAPTLGFGADRVGLFVGAAYLAAMLSGLASGYWVARIGAVRLSQVAMVACALGATIAASGELLLLALAAPMIGIGYGVINPAASSLLARHAPLARRGLFFSIKQTGVPLGVALAGLLLPLGLRAFGWRPSIFAAALLCAATALALRPLVATLEPPKPPPVDSDAPPEQPSEVAPTAGLATVLRDPDLRRLSLTSFAFAFTQLCFVTFLVSYLNLELSLSLATAAAILAGSQAVSTVARIGWGHVGDRWIDPAFLLGLLGLGMAAACAGLGLLGTGAATAVVVATAAVCAATAMGWNGVFFAELARKAGRSEMAALAGASQFFTFCGSMSGPVVYAEIIRHGGSYGAAYLALAVLPGVAGLAMLRAACKREASASAGSLR